MYRRVYDVSYLHISLDRCGALDVVITHQTDQQETELNYLFRIRGSSYLPLDKLSRHCRSCGRRGHRNVWWQDEVKKSIWSVRTEPQVSGIPLGILGIHLALPLCFPFHAPQKDFLLSAFDFYVFYIWSITPYHDLQLDEGRQLTLPNLQSANEPYFFEPSTGISSRSWTKRRPRRSTLQGD